MLSGEVVGNVQGSECFAYGSAVVDPVLKRAWVFGSERDLCGGKSRDNSTACAPFWQGRRKAGNGVRAWWSDDLVRWHTAQEPALIYPSYPFNTDATPVVGKSLLKFRMVSVNFRIEDLESGFNFNLIRRPAENSIEDALD